MRMLKLLLPITTLALHIYIYIFTAFGTTRMEQFVYTSHRSTMYCLQERETTVCFMFVLAQVREETASKFERHKNHAAESYHLP